MKHLESSSSEDNEAAHQFDLKEHLGKKQTQMNVRKEREEKEEEDSGVDEESTARDSKLSEEYFHGLEDLPWNLNSMEQSVYLSLPQWIKAALLCNLAGQYAIWTFHNNFLPCRLLSYLLLPYTLPATVTVSVSYRLLCWIRQSLYKAVSVLKDMILALGLLPVFLTLHLKRYLLSCFVPRCLSHFTLKEQLQSDKERQVLLSQQCSICLQLSTANCFCITSPKPTSCAFLLNLELEVGRQSRANVLPPSS